LRAQAVADELLTRVPDCVKAGAPFLAGERFEFFEGRALSDVITKNGDVYVLGKTVNQSERLRERGAALEEQAGTAGWQTIEPCIEGLADPEVLFNVLLRRGDAPSRRGEQIPPVALGCRNDACIGGVHLLGLTTAAERFFLPWTTETRRCRSGSDFVESSASSSRTTDCIQIGSVWIP